MSSRADWLALPVDSRALNGRRLRLLVGAAAVVAAAGATAWLTARAGSREAVLAGLALGFAVGWRWPRRAVPIVIVWSLVLGALRKWVLPEEQDLLFFSAHPLLAGAYGGFFASRILLRRPILPEPIARPWVAAWVAWVAIEAINPWLPNSAVGLLGVVTHIFYVPLAYLVADWATRKATLVRGLEWFALLAVPLLALGIVQFGSDPRSPINAYANGELSIATAGGRPRVTSTFSYISGYTAYLQVLVPLLASLLALREVRRWHRAMFALVLALCGINLLMTGSRGPAAVGGASLLLYWLCLRSWGGAPGLRPVRSRWLAIGIAGAAAIALFVPAGQEALSAFTERASHSEDIAPRLVDTFTPFKFLVDAGAAGYGAGSTYQGATRLVANPLAWGDMPRDFEEEPERMLLELGLVGYLLTYIVRFLILLRAWRTFRALRDPDLRAIALAVVVFQLPFLHLGSVVHNLTAGLFYWASVGLVLALPRIERQAAGSNACRTA